MCTTITYENGTKINTSFVTNLDEIKGIRILKDFINERQYNEQEYEIPENVIGMKTIFDLNRIGIEMYIKKDEFAHVSNFDIRSKKHLYGGGIVLSDKTLKKVSDVLDKNKHVYEFSDKEKEILKRLNERK